MTRVCAVTVTYGDRFSRLCRETVDRARESGAEPIVVVNNGLDAVGTVELTAYAAEHSDVLLVDMGENTGSARGFGAGLQAARGTADLIWLLDDDNWAEPATLATLVEQRERIVASCGHDRVAISAFRQDNGFHRRVRDGIPPARAYPPAGAFFGIDVAAFLVRALKEALAATRSASTAKTIPGVPYAPYGGLLVPVLALDDIGYPDESLGLYADDTEWTSRLPRSGYVLALSLTASLQDADPKWVASGKPSPLGSMLAANQMMRLYYSTRNRIMFDLRNTTGGAVRLRYQVNRFVVTAAVKLYGRKHREGRELFSRAVGDAERSVREGVTIDSFGVFAPLSQQTVEENGGQAAAQE